jgi:hypothetical protein
MKHLVLLLLFCCGLSPKGFCQEPPQAQMTFQVVDETGAPVAMAELYVLTFHHSEAGEAFGKDVPEKIKLTTDAKGTAIATMSSLRGEFTYSAVKAGSHYDTLGLSYRFMKSLNGKWQPWNPTVRVELRRILKPVPLISCRISSASQKGLLKLPSFTGPVGFDLEARDWTAPHGKGRVADITFRLTGQTNELNAPYNSKLTMTFGHPLNGIVEQPGHPFRGSILRVPHQAPVKGYKAELLQTRSLVAGKRSEGAQQDQNYFLRIRSKTDDKGNLISAQFAKIYGDFEWDPTGLLGFQYYLNPTPNDRNLEFAVKSNLLKVASGEEVREP